jgi:hypothetical protein
MNELFEVFKMISEFFQPLTQVRILYEKMNVV